MKQREIKFKAWDKKAKVMVTVLGIDFENEEILCYADDHKQNIHTENYKLSFKDCGLIEFTGLKDKNGKEIYEGDKFKITEKPNETNVVEYYLGHYSLTPHGLHLEDWNERGEVIGNIYENPELLKEDEKEE